jgi:hypothetical protein
MRMSPAALAPLARASLHARARTAERPILEVCTCVSKLKPGFHLLTAAPRPLLTARCARQTARQGSWPKAPGARPTKKDQAI